MKSYAVCKPIKEEYGQEKEKKEKRSHVGLIGNETWEKVENLREPGREEN